MDQNTFNPHAGDPPVVPKPASIAAAKPPGPPPLVTIPPAATNYAEPLARAVAAARARKPGVLFDVVEIQPPDAPPDQTLGANAVAAARIIAGQGVPPNQVRLAARPDPAGVAGEVRVFVR